MTRHDITVYFDPICAWSCIGHRSMFQAIELFQKTYPGAKQDDFSISWRPYYRESSLPDVGVPLEQRLELALGTGGSDKIKTRVERIGRSHGINFVFKSIIGNTRSCHRIIYAVGLSHGSNAQKQLIEHIYFQWHEVGADVTSFLFLAECAETVGFSKEDAMEVLESGRYAEEVDRLDADARAGGVSCVPTFDIGGTRIEGAEDTATFFEMLVKSKEASANTNSTISTRP